MEKISLFFKGTTAVVGSIVSALVGGIGLTPTILLGVMTADTITGLMAGYGTGKLKSSVGIKGLLRKLYILILLAVIYMLQPLADFAQFTGDGITIAFIIMEVLSILENGGKLGVPIPQKLKDAIEVLKGKDNNGR